MKINRTELVAQLMSELLVWTLYSVAVQVVGYQIPDVDETMYPKVWIVISIYAAIGFLLMHIKMIQPKMSKKIHDGKIDLEWGLKYWYWSLWWPSFRKS